MKLMKPFISEDILKINRTIAKGILGEMVVQFVRTDVQKHVDLP